MKKFTSSMNNNRDINSSQRKRMRSSTPAREEEDSMKSVNQVSPAGLSQKKAKHMTAEGRKEKKNGSNNQAGHSTTVGSTPSGSSISFSSSSLKGAATTNNSKAAHGKSNPSTETKEKKHHGKLTSLNDSFISKENSSNRASSTANSKSRPLNATTTDTVHRTVTLQSKTMPSPLTSRENVLSQMTNGSSQRRNELNLLRSDYSSSTPLNDSNLGTTTGSIGVSIEGSLEYREMKRLYLHERNQAEEWKKDYYVLKKQLSKVKASTIPRPTAEVLEWLKELLYLMDNDCSFIGDGRDLKQIGEDLGLDETALLTVTARTPQKSALKLFRLLHPTIGNRASCGSITEMCQTQLQNIYYYVRNLHKNLSFTKDDMRKAIGTSIRTARRDIRRQQQHQQQRAQAMHDQQNTDPDGTDEGIADTMNEETTFDRAEDFLDEAEDDDDEGESNDDIEDEDRVMIDEEFEDDTENDDDEKGTHNAVIGEELDEDSE